MRPLIYVSAVIVSVVLLWAGVGLFAVVAGPVLNCPDLSAEECQRFWDEDGSERGGPAIIVTRLSSDELNCDYDLVRWTPLFPVVERHEPFC